MLIVLLGCGDRGIGTNERAWLLTMRPVWIAAARAEHCPRPALRTPATGDGSTRLRRLNDKDGPEQHCLAEVRKLQPELGPCWPGQTCGPQALATIKPHPELLDACAPLFADIEELAHASEACSPTLAPSSPAEDEVVLNWGSLGNAIRLEIAPLVAAGQLGEAARRTLDTMRVVDDLGRKSTLLGTAFSSYVSFRMVDTLDELATDPRLTAGDARAMARDLDVLLASAPRWVDVMHHERAYMADFLGTEKTDFVPSLAELDVRTREFDRVCSGSLRDCVEHYDDIHDENAFAFKDYVQRLGLRDYALAFVRMQVELRVASIQDCSDPARRRAILAPWADHVIVGDECDPVVTPPMWERGSQYKPRPVPRALHCIAAAP